MKPEELRAMTEQPTREEIERALYQAARAYLASLDGSAPLGTQYRARPSHGCDEPAGSAEAPVLTNADTGPKDGTREPPLTADYELGFADGFNKAKTKTAPPVPGAALKKALDVATLAWQKAEERVKELEADIKLMDENCHAVEQRAKELEALLPMIIECVEDSNDHDVIAICRTALAQAEKDTP